VKAEKGRKILIAMDGTKYSEKAAKWVNDNLARDDDVIVLVSVWEEAMVEKLFAELDAEILHPETDITHSKHHKLNDTFEKAKCFIGHEKLHGLIVETSTRIAPKSIGEELCALGKRMDINVIVCGTRGLGAIKKAFLGSVSSYLSQNAQCTVTIVK
jgi:nucleotide-binding universal stress UspA family protein